MSSRSLTTALRLVMAGVVAFVITTAVLVAWLVATGGIRQ